MDKLQDLIALVRKEAHEDMHKRREMTSFQAAALELAAEVEKKMLSERKERE